MGKICGYISNKNIKKEVLLNMIQTINQKEKHIDKFNDLNVGIANIEYYNSNKLLNSKELIICIDGTISNKKEICDELKTNITSDLELLRKLYIKYNEKFTDKIEGFFAILIYDKKENKLVLVRDKIGTKQLYYYINDDCICFSSELKSIIKYPDFEKKINNNALSMYFRYTYINAPQTIFKNTYKLQHGHYIVWKDGKVEDKTYWDGIKKYNSLSKKQVKSFNKAKENLKNIIKENLEDIINSNENFGIYLSGGIDSSLISSICNKISKKTINTFSIGFYEEEKNEAENAKKIAQYLKTNHKEIYINKEELLSIIKKIPQYYDEPFSDTSVVPTIILNEFASENNINVAITGDGADQLFCGSTIYCKINLLQKLYGIFNPLNIQINLKFILRSKLKYFYANTDNKCKTQFDIFSKEAVFKGLFKDTGEKRYNFENKIKSRNWQVKRMMVDVNTFLTNRINFKMNKPSNSNGIEIKSPFLSNRLIEYSFKIPQRFKFYKKENKYILKQILYEYIPKEIFDTEKKGFGSPIEKWLTTYLYNDLLRVSNKEFIEKQNIFNYTKLNELIKNINNVKFYKKTHQILWDFYMFQLWYIEYIEDN